MPSGLVGFCNKFVVGFSRMCDTSGKANISKYKIVIIIDNIFIIE